MITHYPENYNNFKTAHLIFYNYQENKINFLLTKTKDNKYNAIKTEITSYDNSPIIALSRIMSNTFKGLLSERNIELIKRGESVDPLNLNPISYEWHNLHEDINMTEWMFTLCSNPIQYDQVQGHIVYFIEIPDISSSVLNKSLKACDIYYQFDYFTTLAIDEVDINISKLLENINIDEYITKSRNILTNHMLRNKFIVLTCDNRADETNFMYIYKRALFQGIYRSNNEQWYYFAADEELPGEDILSLTKHIVIPGSVSSVYNKPNNSDKVIRFIQTTVKQYPKIKFTGICYGHQILCHAFGSEVRKMDKAAELIESIKLVDSFWELDFIKSSGVSKRESIVSLSHHGDCVKDKPDCFIHYGSSGTCNLEILLSENGRIFSIQSHPEFTPECLLLFTQPYYLRNIENILESYEKLKDELLKCFEGQEELDNDMVRICFSFMKLDI
jgi:GMP synthase-like glutamine amidotransferase